MNYVDPNSFRFRTSVGSVSTLYQTNVNNIFYSFTRFVDRKPAGNISFSIATMAFQINANSSIDYVQQALANIFDDAALKVLNAYSADASMINVEGMKLFRNIISTDLIQAFGPGSYFLNQPTIGAPNVRLQYSSVPEFPNHN